MATIQHEFFIPRPIEQVWLRLSDVGNVHRQLAVGFVTHTELEGDCRIVTFANGVTVRERIITVDPERYRVVYSVLGAQVIHHQGVMQLVSESANSTRMLWTVDFLPESWRATLAPMMETGARVMQSTLSAE